MSSESGILVDHTDQSDEINDDDQSDNFKQNISSSPELLLEAIRRIGRDKLRNIMLDLSYGSEN